MKIGELEPVGDIYQYFILQDEENINLMALVDSFGTKKC